MDSPLLKEETPELHAQEDSGLLSQKEHSLIRLVFVLGSQFLFFILGAGFYVFPLWLNFVVTDHIDFSREALASLGAVPFIGLLGLAGAVIIFVNWLKFGDKTSKFIFLIFLPSAFVILSWGLLYHIVVDQPKDINHSSFVIIFVILLLMGTAVGIFFTMLLDKLFPLIKVKHHFIYSALCNMNFALGSIFSLGAKLFMNVNTWMKLMLAVECATVAFAFLFVWMYVDQICLSVNHADTAEVSTKKLLTELMQWKRQSTKETLMLKDCTVRSSQFYWLVASFTAVCTLSTCFMANLGPLLSAESSDEDDFRAQLIVLLWASVGQTVARIAIPFVAHWVGNCISANVAAANQTTVAASDPRLKDVIQTKVSNATTLPLTFIIGLVFFVFLLALKMSNSVSFIVASTVISGAYGSMWVVTNTFPLFFPKYNFAVLLSFFQLIGMVGMIIFVVITSYALQLDNDGIFVSLLAASVVTMVVTVAAMVDRYLTEPSAVVATAADHL